MNENVKLLSKPTNFAVVHLLERKYPGVVFQGDSLHSLVKKLQRIQLLLNSNCIEDLNIELGEICEDMAAVLTDYETVSRTKDSVTLP
ncbi:DUF6959 family protein [Undibacterium sp. Ji50W]|uniref:DUF6959 family protein n=1 Tax=Undibacterium sp. Ji50W TaxID=3413041 RepID=UPI003BEF56AA